MGALSRKLRNCGSEAIAFWCPGCDSVHAVWVSSPRNNWTFDGNVEMPTFNPSILVTYNGAGADQPGEPPSRCHSFVKGGRIEFLTDCTHALAGKTVDLPDFPSDFACS